MAGTACPSCATENPATARFCMACGTALPRACPSCGEAAPGEARFCMNCGASLEAITTPAAPPGPTVPTPVRPPLLSEERRQVTVLFADVSGYTAMSERMDPEDVKGLIDRCLRRLGDEVDRYGGTVDKYIGDNVMAIFGAPVAHEDDAERAVRAGLGMQAAMDEINADIAGPYDVSLALRVGVNTGEVIAGAMGESYTVIGDTVNVAARLQAAAQPGSVTVGARTYRATRDAISYEELEPLTLKGKAEPVSAWDATGALAAAPSRRALPAREAPLVGRDDELALLQSIYGRVVRESRPHLVTLVGQAGVGKSRLLREYELALAGTDPVPTFRQGRCLPYGSSIVYWALGEVVRAEFSIVDGDSSEAAWEKLRNGISKLLGESEDVPPEARDRRSALIGRLLGIEVPVDPGASETLDPARMRESFFSAVRFGIEAMGRRSPLVLAFEDIHWADHGMLDLIEYLAQWVRAPVLVLCLARDELLERRPSWGGGRRSATSIFLEPLSTKDTRDLIGALLPGPASEDLVEGMAERAGGNPLFAEEMVRLTSEAGGGDAEGLPDTVQALLAARLDSLEPFERRLVQQASVVGRTFWEGSLAAVAAEEGGDLDAGLNALQEKDIVVPGEGARLAGEPELAFKHVLIRDVAYGMLPKAVRARKHFQVGGFIEDRVGERSDEVVALLAEHYGRAATLASEARLDAAEREPIDERARHFLEAAGDAAASFYSNREAVAHYRAARELSPADEAARARIGEKEGDVALRLGRVDTAIEVWEECLEFHRRADDLERVAGLHRKVGAALWHRGERKPAIEHHQQGINLLKDGEPSLELVRLYQEAASLYMQTGDNMLAIYAAEKSLRLAERLGETRAASRAHGIFGRVFGRIGDMAKARENLERSVELARGLDQSETILALLALGHHLEVFEADDAGAERAYADALALAEEVGDVPARVELLAARAQIASYRADWEAVQTSSDASAELAEREGLVGKLCLPMAMRGWLAWREGNWEAAEQRFGRAHELAEQVGWSEVAFSALFGLAATLRDREDYSAAAGALARALEVCERAGLIAQQIQAASARAVVLAADGDLEAGREAADQAAELAERVPYPLGEAAGLEAQGATTPGAEGVAKLHEAAERWTSLGRVLDAARCELLAGHALRDADPEAAGEALEDARAAFERLGVVHLAERARALAAG
jgi:class 3 adenylate cyclase/tetratricopeptide (TPR) repeat protein